MREVFEETRLRVACHMAIAKNKWIKAAWRLETLKENSSIINDAIIRMQSIGKQIELRLIKARVSFIVAHFRPEMFYQLNSFSFFTKTSSYTIS